MDFSGTEAWLRGLTFAGILAGAAVICWWVLSARTSPQWQQLAAAVGALATIPAAIAAPVTGDGALTALGLVSIAGFLACAVVAVIPGPRAILVPTTAAAPSPSNTPSTASRVALSPAALTEVRSAPAAHQTVALRGSAPPIAEIAYLADASADGHPHRLGADTRIGRDSVCELILEDSAASREHCRVKLEDGRFVLYDLGSTNGTRLVRAGRRRRVAAPVPLTDLDTIEIGETRLVFLNVELPHR